MNFAGVNESGLDEPASSGDAFEATIAILQKVAGLFQATTQIGMTVYSTLPDFNTAALRRVSVTLAGVDVTSSLVELVTVEAEASMARVATFTISPAAGTVNLPSWIGSSVTINHDVMVGAVVQLRTRMFTGIVDVPKFDPQTGRVTFHCTDDIQGAFDKRSRADIDLLTPGAFYSDPINGKDLQGYKYMKTREESLTASIDLDPFQKPRVTSWDIGTADYTFTASDVLANSELVELTTSREVVNNVSTTFTFRYTRLREKFESGSWTLPGSSNWCTFLGQPVTLPNREMVIQALQGTSWIPASVNFTPVPATGVFMCPGATVWTVNDQLRDQLITGASWTLKKRFTQTVSEVYNLTVRSPQSEAGVSVRNVSRNAGFTADYDAASWIAEGTETSTLLNTGGGGITSGSQLGGSGDFFEDKDDESGFSRAQAEAGISWSIGNATRSIREAHRMNQVAFDVVLNPNIDLNKVARINTPRIQATGRVKKVVHSIDLSKSSGKDGGATRTGIQIAISRSYVPPAGSISVSTSPLTVPVKPDTISPGTVPGTSVNSRTTHIGGILTAPEFSEEWVGFMTNYMSPDYFGTGSPLFPEAGSEIYPVQFVVESPEIPAPDVEENKGTKEQEYIVEIPDNELVLVAP